MFQLKKTQTNLSLQLWAQVEKTIHRVETYELSSQE